MAIEFRCIACGKLLRVPDGTAGKQAKCPACSATVTIPTPELAPPRSEPVMGPFAVPAPADPVAVRIPDPASGGGAEATNPYQSPGQYAAAPPPRSGYAYAVDREFAAARVAGPATWLIVTGALGFPVQAAGVVINLFQFGAMGFGPKPDINEPAFMVFAGGYSAVMAVLGIAMSVLVIVGAIKMKRLESYGLAMTAAVIAMCPGISPCCLLGLPFGIWALTVLCDARVKAAFPR